jgi:uncharacterized protein YndB with AHSA1/START domain
MATAQVTPENDTVVASIFIAAPPARVFEAISDPKQTAQWWGQKGVYRIIEAHSDVRPGGKWLSRRVGADGTEFSVSGKYLEVEPPRLIVYTWNSSYAKMPETIVRCELEPQEIHGLHQSGPHRAGTGTRVTIRHSGFAGKVEQCQRHGQGWVRVLGWMQAFIEKGETIETRA